MKKIGTLHLTSLHVSSHVEFHKSCYGAMSARQWGNAKWEALLVSYASGIDTLDNVVRRQRASIYTSDVDNADALRDGTMGQFFLLVDAGAKSSLAAEKAAATKVQTIIKPYRRDVYDQLTDQTEQVRGMITALSTDVARPLIDTLGLSAVLQRLGEQNEAFAEVYRLRATDRQGQPAAGVDTKVQRKAVDDDYNSLTDIANGASVVLDTGIDIGIGAADVDALIDEINAYIAQYKLVIANQGKKKADNTQTTTTES